MLEAVAALLLTLFIATILGLAYMIVKTIQYFKDKNK